ncbi:putative hydroxyacylglutathione hydrolase with metallo-hydrolase/oxidoreductase domain [Pseudoalteromonas tunicata D2]|jgi:hydroxyacylglutathione hydrolase|uniref:Hydroxyacylglutathione hydrolase n=2 Tax=Pseudoalteromonas tunicata TaxID=314281 RepID=A4C5I6_9GAMM|nr:putative hydroxyacylglutathione hydrolase with metallo-hydrolase/oxidoreductase domain [Pseudoalteromonas tunicata D2]
MTMLQVKPIKAFKDNYIWAIINTENQHCVVVDPGDAEPVIAFISEHQLTLSAILITHHHWDHTNGVEKLCSLQASLPVYGPKNSPFAGITEPLSANTVCQLTDFDLSFHILATPGHTLDHICYYEPQQDWLFCGDTLFSGGCGRLFEGTADQMFQSMVKLSQLPDKTAVYCTHEYTQSNLIFALVIEPQNLDLLQHHKKVDALRLANKASLPSSIGLEKKINPFMRSTEQHITEHVPIEHQQALTEPWHGLAVLRRYKDHF